MVVIGDLNTDILVLHHNHLIWPSSPMAFMLSVSVKISLCEIKSCNSECSVVTLFIASKLHRGEAVL